MSSEVETYDFDVAVSFAGEDREFATHLAEQLKSGGVRVFVDTDHAADLLGEDLAEYFDGVYRLRSRYAVILISQSYAAKMWTSHERKSALARALMQEGAYVLPIRLDDTPLPGLRPTIGYLDARDLGRDGVAAVILEKLRSSPAVATPDTTRVPRTEFERQAILVSRPSGWEFLYFAAELLHHLEQSAGKYADHEMRYAERNGNYVAESEMPTFIKRSTDEAQSIVAVLLRVMDPVVQEKAMGAPGQAGDAARIQHLAQKWSKTYEDLMDWAHTIRGVTTTPQCSELLEMLARFVDEPVEAYRDFVKEIVRQADDIPRAISAGEPVVISNVLELRISNDKLAAYNYEIDKLQGRLP